MADARERADAAGAMEDEDDIPGKVGDVIRLGLVSSVDLGAGLAVVQCGEIESPPCPWLELAGAFRTWTPPSVGEQVVLICPEGDIAGAVIARGLLSNSFPAIASDEDHHVHGSGGLKIRLTARGIEIEAPGDVEISGDVKITGKLNATGTITSDTDVIAAGISGKSHRHGGVQSGPSTTAVPQ